MGISLSRQLFDASSIIVGLGLKLSVLFRRRRHMHPGFRHFLAFIFLLALFVPGFSQSQTGSSISEVAKQHSRSIVQIATQDRNGKNLVSGSGFIVKPEGVVVTNYHVIEGAHASFHQNCRWRYL